MSPQLERAEGDAALPKEVDVAIIGGGIIGCAAAIYLRRAGVRVALGAHTANILALVLRSSLRLALSGVIVGLPAAFALSRTLTALLYGTPPADLRSYIASAVILLALALAAAFVPALRAARVNPIYALRTE